AGLDHLKLQVKARRDEILNQIRNKEATSPADEEWLDNEGNLVDEERVIDLLDESLDYEQGPENCKIVLQSEKKKEEPTFTKKENATLKQRVQILDWHHEQGKGFKQKDTAAHWNCIYPNLALKQPLISDWLKNEAKICQMYKEELAMGRAGNTKHPKQTEHPEVNEMLKLWIMKAMLDEVQVNGEIIWCKWHCFADLVGVPMDDRITSVMEKQHQQTLGTSKANVNGYVTSLQHMVIA
ncbi:hypothetical protein C0991_006662, partial [Blastosporella zonata]